MSFHCPLLCARGMFTTLKSEMDSYDLGNDLSVCRDYLRNVCTRGDRCKFLHPPKSGIRREKEKLLFCHDFQNKQCSRHNCGFIHCSLEEEELYKSTGELPKHLLNDAIHKGLLFPDGNELDAVPVCKDSLKGECRRGNKCKFRHLPKRPAPSNYSDKSGYSDQSCSPERKIGRYDDSYSPSLPILTADQPPSPIYNGRNFQNYTAEMSPHELRMLQEENLLLKRRVEDLKKQVSDLLSTNDFLLEQNAHLRLAKATSGNITNSVASLVTSCIAVTSSVGSLPGATIAQLPTLTSISHSGLTALVTSLPTNQATLSGTALPMPITMSGAAAAQVMGSVATIATVPVSLSQGTSITSVSIAPVTITTQSGLASAVVSLAPTLGTTLQLANNTTLSLSGSMPSASLVSYPIMTQSLMPALQNSM